MKELTKIRIYTLTIIGILLMLSYSCKKKDNASQPLTITDIDGNVYYTVTIGTQVWMVENLRTTKFNDGSTIPLVTNGSAWGSLNSPAYCWYNNDISDYKNIYGALYNWFSINSNKLAPAGWHVPTDEDWLTLANYLGGDSVAGGKMKVPGTKYWLGPNAGANNSSGFTGLPGGYRDYQYDCINLGGGAFFWSSTQCFITEAWGRYLFYSQVHLSRQTFPQTTGLSVRCLKN